MLKATNLIKRFDDRLVLSNFNYTFESSGIYLLRGKSGVGKTTLLRILAGLDTEYEGEISPLTSVSFSFQEHRLFPWLSALKNAEVSLLNTSETYKTKRAEEMLASLGFTPHDMKLKPSELSGGMQARVSLARAFLKDSDLLLLDEPTKELDSALVRKVCELINSFAEHRLVIISTHDDLEQYLNVKDIIHL